MIDARITLVVAAARARAIDAPEDTVEAFAASVLGVPAPSIALFNNGTFLDELISNLQSARDSILSQECDVPGYVIYRLAAGGYRICGLVPYLQATMPGTKAADRASGIPAVAAAIEDMGSTAHLEALAAALLKASMEAAKPTVLVGDQGVDALGWSTQLAVLWPFALESPPLVGAAVCEKRFVIASSKSTEYRVANGGKRPSLDPAMVRELIGGWLIQRHHEGMWSKLGIKMLSPIQLVLVTTYRLSPDVKALCANMGVEIWMIPHLTFLVCEYARDAVFPPAAGHVFDAAAFTAWVEESHADRFAVP